MNNFVWGPHSSSVRDTLHPDLVRIVDRMLEILNAADDGVDVSLVQGARTQAQADEYAAAGKGSSKSKHIATNYEDGKARALDFRATGPAKYALPAIRIIRGAGLQAADELNIPVRSGGDWNCNGIETQADPAERLQKLLADHVHIELLEDGEKRFNDAKKARIRRMGLRASGERWPL